MTLDTILLIALAAFAVLGLIIGLAKGFTKLSTCLTEVALATAAPALIFKYVNFGELLPQDGELPAELIEFAIALGSALIVMLLAKFVFHCFKKGTEKSMAKASEYSSYKNYEKDEEVRDEMRDAAAENDKRTYRKGAKKLHKPSTGAAGVGNRFWGGLFGALQGAIACALLAGFALFVLDLLQLEAMEEMLAPIWENEIWLAVKFNVLDAVLVLVLYVTVVQGFRSGLFEKLWGLVSIAVIAGAAFFAYTLAFGEGFATPVANLAAWLDANVEMLAQVSAFVSSTLIAQIVLTLVMFLVLLVPCILILVFVPKLLENVRQAKWFYGLDGVLGAVTMFVIIFGLLLVVGMVLSMLSELDVMQAFGAYMEGGAISKFFYTATPFKGMEFYGMIDEWFAILRGAAGPSLG